MKEWTREERYRTILEASNEELTELRDIVNSCPYRQKFHIQPTTGLLNDPNGFSYYNNEYRHLCGAVCRTENPLSGCKSQFGAGAGTAEVSFAAGGRGCSRSYRQCIGEQ